MSIKIRNLSEEKEKYNNIPEEYKKYFAVPKLSDLSYIADNLFEEHKNELGIFEDKKPTPRESLERAYQFSNRLCLTLVDNDKVMGIGGVDDSNGIWLLLTKDALQSFAMKELLTVKAKGFLDYLLDTYAPKGFLENVCLASNKKQIKWFEFLGAEILPLTIQKKEFVAFIFTKKEEVKKNNV